MIYGMLNSCVDYATDGDADVVTDVVTWLRLDREVLCRVVCGRDGCRGDWVMLVLFHR